jgi:hypothetical protein
MTITSAFMLALKIRAVPKERLAICFKRFIAVSFCEVYFGGVLIVLDVVQYPSLASAFFSKGGTVKSDRFAYLF